MSLPSVAGAATGDADAPAERICGWCRKPLTTLRGRFCGRRCRQTAFRLRRRRPLEAPEGGGRKRFAYADQVHTETVTPTRYFSRLVARLRAFDGWAISLAPAMLRTVIPLCPRQARVACWTSQPQRAPKKGIEGAWEAVIVVPARTLRPGVLDALVVKGPPGGEGAGGKPLAFPAWLFALLGMVDGDTLTELTPETGADVGRGWIELTRPIPKRRRRRRAPTRVGVDPDGKTHHVRMVGAGGRTAATIDGEPVEGSDPELLGHLEGAGESGQKHTPAEPPEAPADPGPSSPPDGADKIN